MLQLFLLFFLLNCVQWNFNGSNTFGTMQICSRRGYFELMTVNHSARSDGIISCFFFFFVFLSHEGMLCVLIRIASMRHNFSFKRYEGKISTSHGPFS